MHENQISIDKVRVKAQQLVAEKSGFPTEEIQSETVFSEVGLDSLDVVEIAMELEKEFAVSIPDDLMEASTSMTVEDICQATLGQRA